MRLRCKGNYHNNPRNIIHTKDQEFDVNDELATFLLADAPGCFEEVQPVQPEVKQVRQKSVRRPVKDKMVHGPVVDK